jgi:hypothetical protein
MFNTVSVTALLNKHHADPRQMRDFGFGIEEYCRRLGLNDPLRARRETSLFRYFPFDRCVTQDIGDIELAAMVRRRQRLGNIFRACPTCVELESATHGCAIWHLTQQLPLVLVCVEHQEELIGVPVSQSLRLPAKSDLRRGCGTPSPFRHVLASAEVEVFSKSALPQQRTDFEAAVRRCLFKPSDGRVAAADCARTLRSMCTENVPLLSPYMDASLESSIEAFIRAPGLFVDSRLLSLLVVLIRGMDVSPCRLIR